MTQATVCATGNDPVMQGAYGVRRSETHFTHGLTSEEITRAGEAVLMLIGTSVALGHVSPNGAMDYAVRPGDETTRSGASSGMHSPRLGLATHGTSPAPD